MLDLVPPNLPTLEKGDSEKYGEKVEKQVRSAAMLSPSCPTVVDVHRNDDVLVLSTSVDFNDVAWNTITKLKPEWWCPPGPDEVIEAIFRDLLLFQQGYGTLFINPQFFVQAATPTAQFFKEARRAQSGWFKALNSALFSARRVKRLMKQLSPLLRQLYFTGVMFIEGTHTEPTNWPIHGVPQKAKDLVGRRFGRLTVEHKEPHDRWWCRCDCGGRNAILTKHLIRGRIRSCGCLKREVDEKRQARRNARAWRHTGPLKP